jgi:hypothetical protein
MSISSQAMAETLFPLSPMLPGGFLSFVMIMKASSELLHHESSAKGTSPSACLYDLFVRSLDLRSVKHQRVHNSKLFGTLSLIPGAVKSPNIPVFPPSYALYSLADESIVIPTRTPKSTFAVPSYTPHCSRENVGTQSLHPVIRACSGYCTWAETIFADWQ